MLLVGKIANINLNNSAVAFNITDNLIGDVIDTSTTFKPKMGKTFRRLKFIITAQNTQISEQTIYVNVVENLSSTFIRTIFYDKVPANTTKSYIFEVDYLFKAIDPTSPYNYSLVIGSTGVLSILYAQMIQEVQKDIYYSTSY